MDIDKIKQEIALLDEEISALEKENAEIDSLLADDIKKESFRTVWRNNNQKYLDEMHLIYQHQLND